MSVKAMSWVFTLEELPPRETLVLLALADAANDRGLAWPSQARLAPKARCSQRSLRRYIQFLKDAGLVEVMSRSSQGGRKSNVYQLNLNAQFSLADMQSVSLSGCEISVDNFSGGDGEAADLPREISNGSNCPIADEETSQPDRGDLSQPDKADRLLPYGDLEPSLEPSTIQGESVDELGQVSGAGVDWELLSRVLGREVVSRLGRSAGIRLQSLLRRAFREGWSESQLRQRFVACPIPEGVRNFQGFVIYRLRDLVYSPVPVDVEERAENLGEERLLRVREVLDGVSGLSWRSQVLLVNSFLDQVTDYSDDFVKECDAWLLKHLDDASGVDVSGVLM